MEGLKNILTKKPLIKRVWVNDRNEWLFSPAKGFVEILAKDILEGKYDVIEESVGEVGEATDTPEEQQVSNIEEPKIEENKRVKKNKKR